MANKIKAFFKCWEDAWAAIPSYIKVFLYSTSSSAFGLWITGELNWRAVVIIVATNLGIYSAPRIVNNQVKKLA